MSRLHHRSQTENSIIAFRAGSHADRRLSDPATLREDPCIPRSMPHESFSRVASPIFPREAGSHYQAVSSHTRNVRRHQDEATTKSSFPNRLSADGLKFIHEVRPNDIEACANFIASHHEILGEIDADQKYSFVAARAFEKGDQNLSRNCVLKGMMIAFCSGMDRGEIGRFFQLLQQGENPTSKKFYGDCEGKERDIAYRVQSRMRERARSLTESSHMTSAALQRIKSQTVTTDEGSDASTIRAVAPTSKSSQSSKQSKTAENPHIQSTSLHNLPNHPLSALGHQFVEIPESKFKDCYKFLNSHSSEIDFTDYQLLMEAERALQDGQRRCARRCIQRSLLLQKWRETSDREKYFRQLQAEDSMELMDMLKSFDKTLRALEDKMPVRPGDKTNSRPSLAECKPSTSSQSSAARKEDRRTSESQGAIVAHLQKRPTKAFRSREAPALSLPDMSRPTSRQASSLPDSSRLDARYQIQRPTFYSFGTVFAVMWHEAAHRLEQDVTYAVESARFVEPVFSYVRRFVVVKPGHGYCWSVPISTYGGRGLKKAGLTKNDIEAHAVIHFEGERAKTLPNEPTTHKKAITMVPASEDQYLNSPTMSRINFAKVFTIEYNAKSMHVGTVSKKSLPLLKQYFEEQLKLD